MDVPLNKQQQIDSQANQYVVCRDGGDLAPVIRWRPRVVSSGRNGSDPSLVSPARALLKMQPVQFRPSGAALGQWVSPTISELGGTELRRAPLSRDYRRGVVMAQ